MPDLFPLRVIDRYALTGQVHISFFVQGHAVRALFYKQPAIAQCMVFIDGVYIGFIIANIRHIQVFTVGCSHYAIWLLQIGVDNNWLVFSFRQIINFLAVKIGLSACPPWALIVGVGHINPPLAVYPYIVGSVHRLALVIL